MSTRIATSAQRRRLPRRDPATLEERLQPTQLRAKQTVDMILETAAHLLAEGGIDSFNTNLLAHRAGVRVRSIYRYYPNKLAVISALWKKMIQEWDVLLAPGLRDLLDPEKDIIVGWEEMVRTYIQWVTERPGAWAVRSTIRALPELREQEKWAEDWVVSRVARAMEKRGLRLPKHRIRTICLVMYRGANAILHTEFVYHGRPRKAVFDEMEIMIRLYLQHYLGKEHRTVRGL